MEGSGEMLLVAVVIVITVVVVIPPAIAVAVAIPVPAMIMLEPPVVTIPVAGIKLATLVPGSDPRRAVIWRPGPISSVPPIPMTYRIPIPVYPIIIRVRRNGANTHHAGTWWRPNPNSKGYLSAVSRRSGQKHPGKHRGQ